MATVGPASLVGTSESPGSATDREPRHRHWYPLRGSPTRSSTTGLLADRTDRPSQVIERQLDGARLCPDQISTRWDHAIVEGRGECRPQSATEPVADHCGSHRATDRECQARRNIIGIHDDTGPQRTLHDGIANLGPDPDPITLQLFKLVTVPNPPDHTVSRARPLARRDFNTARPARVLIRARNPCFLARRRAFGWYVRFMVSFSS